jgi:hypothetical protein
MKKNSPLQLLILVFLVHCQNGMGQISSGEVAFNAVPPHTSMHFGGSTFTAELNGTTTSDNLIPSTLPTGIVSYWTLDETSGNAIDAAGGGNNGTPTSVTQGATGKINTAYSFNGTTSKVDMGASTNLALTTGSVSCWVYMPSLPVNDGIIFEKGDMSIQLYGYGMYYSGGNLVFETASNTHHTNYYANTGVILHAGVWYHVVCTWNGTTVVTYLNGNQTLSASQATPTVFSTYDFGLGKNLPTNTAGFAGTIDEAGVWGRALTAAEVTSLYSSGTGNQYPFGGVPNIPPVAIAGPNQNLSAGITTTTLSGSGTDADGVVVSYACLHSSYGII